MGEHRTSDSRAIIDAIVSVGESLGYDARREWEIPNTGPNSEHVDIALFGDKAATAPTLAIEVDSTDAPASTSNAVKIFGKQTTSLVKPFFVFHVFLRPAIQGHRRQNMQVLLGTHNYDTYDFGESSERGRFL